MKIRFACPECKTKYVAKPEQAGHRGKCKKCGTPIVVAKVESIETVAEGKTEETANLYNPTDKSETSDNGATSKTRSNTLLVLLSVAFIVIAIGLLKFESATYPTLSDKVFGMFGYNLGRAFVITLVLYFGWKKFLKEKMTLVFLIFATILFGSAIYQHIKVIEANEKITQTETFKSALKDLSSLTKDIISGQDFDEAELPDKDYGEISEVINLLKGLMTQEMTIIQKMKEELNELNLETILTRETLENPNQIIVAQVNLQKAIGVLDRCENDFREMFASGRQRISESNQNSDLKGGQAVKGFKSGLDKSLKNVLEFLSIKRSNFSTRYSLLNFIKGKKGKYSFKNNQIFFSSSEDVEIYNKFMEEIDLSAEGEGSWIFEALSNQKKLDEYVK